VADCPRLLFQKASTVFFGALPAYV